MISLSDIFIKLLNINITACYVIVIIIAVRILFRKFPKKYSYYLWGFAGLRLIFPFSVTSIFSFFNINNFTDIKIKNGIQEYIPLDIGFADTPKINTGIEYINKAVNSVLPPAENYNSVNPMQILIFIAALVWATVMLLILVYEIFLYLRTKKLVRKAVIYKDNIYECDNIPTPFVMGVIRPKIYIPFRLGETELSFILCHEKYHIKRCDNIIKIISSFIIAVHWFNPFVWMAYFLMNRDMEMSCDEKVISEKGKDSIKDYSSYLLSFALNKRHFHISPIAFGESSISKRVKNILKFKEPKIWLSFLGTLIIIITGIICLTNESKIVENTSTNTNNINNNYIDNAAKNSVFNDRINFIVAGIENNSNFTDTIMVGSYVISKNELNILSIPRDTYVSFTDEQKQIMKESGRIIPDTVKIGSLNSYGGDEYGIKFLKEQVEKILDININYYFKIDTDGLKNIVDSVNGIYFDVPEPGMYYSDPVQDLYIKIDAGYQLLDGNTAEGLIRFRKGYPRQDLQRIEVSREFIKEFIKQITERETIKNNLSSIFLNCIKYIETDFKISDINKYIEGIKNFNINNFKADTIPGNFETIDKSLYYIPDTSETEKISKKFFY